MMYVYFGLGTNLGDKEYNLRLAVRKIEERVGKVVSLSAFYATAPWGFSSEHTFLNAAACVETLLPPLSVLHLGLRGYVSSAFVRALSHSGDSTRDRAYA